MVFYVNGVTITVITEVDEKSGHSVGGGAIVSTDPSWSGMSSYHLHAQLVKMIAVWVFLLYTFELMEMIVLIN